ncbi:MAG: CPBP family intramembrane glutamic endopeptidase [Candidatus Thorarchaeota archaeon]
MDEFDHLNQLSRSLGKYIIITFTFSWLFWLPSLLSSFQIIPYEPIYNLLLVFGGFGPFVASFSLTIKEGGKEGGIALWSKGWHCEKKLYLIISLTAIPILCIIALLLANIFEGGTIFEYIDRYRSGYIFTEIFVMFFFSGPIQEEFGWRGYALYYLQSKFNAFESSLILGAIWSFWHYPLFLINGTALFNQNFYSYTISLLALSILFTWLNNNTNGSILAAIFFHTSINTTYSLFLYRITPLGSIYFIILLDVFMVTILAIFGQEKLKWSNRKKMNSIRLPKKTY